MNQLKNIDFINVESTFWVANKTVNVPAYDFTFEPLFQITRPRVKEEQTVFARIGAIQDYTAVYQMFLDQGFKLVNTPEQHQFASELAYWYPLLQEFTPKSKVYDTFPTLEEIEEEFDFPVFIKGNRQTAKHDPTLSIATNETDFARIKEAYQSDTILHWQKVVIREFIALKPMQYKAEGKVQISYEFRTFWWKNTCVGARHYWSQYLHYNWTVEEESRALQIAENAAQRLNVPFVAIDLALTAEGEWIIIECNDAQESGYCGVRPHELWRNILAIEITS